MPKLMDTHIHSTTTDISQKVERMQMPTSGWTDKQIVIHLYPHPHTPPHTYTHDGILFGHQKKNEVTDTC